MLTLVHRDVMGPLEPAKSTQSPSVHAGSHLRITLLLFALFETPPSEVNPSSHPVHEQQKNHITSTQD